MAQKESESKRTEKSSPLNVMPIELAEMGKRRVEEFTEVQKALLDKLQETYRHWFERAQTEASLASEFAAKLTAARSIPDAMAVCQEWATRHFEMMADDSKHLLADTQAFMDAGRRLLSNGSSISGVGAST